MRDVFILVLVTFLSGLPRSVSRVKTSKFYADNKSNHPLFIYFFFVFNGFVLL